jgi:sugar-phosphatase
MAQRLFVFDMDGVLIDGERLWEKAKPEIYDRTFGRGAADKLGATTGLSIALIYERALQTGLSGKLSDLENAFHASAIQIYRDAPITNHLDEFERFLRSKEFKIAVVSASPLEWIRVAIGRLPFSLPPDYTLSLHDHPDLRHKPEPDGYLDAMKALDATADSTIILEDSNGGIAAAKASGAYTIALQEHILPGYEQFGADSYAKDIPSVQSIVINRVASTV